MGLLDFLKPQADRYPAPEVVEDENPSVRAWLDTTGKESTHRTYRVEGTGSMKPTLQGDDYAIHEKVPYDDLKEGDIINYRPKWAKGKIIVHRLVQKEKRGWIASGDNNRESESWEYVTPEKYMDKLVKVYRKPKAKPKLKLPE